MTRKVKRTLSLVLALMMICSAMGVMTLAAENADLNKMCPGCGVYRNFVFSYCVESFNRITECPKHFELHDAEEWYIQYWYVCEVCDEHPYLRNTETVYVCLK